MMFEEFARSYARDSRLSVGNSDPTAEVGVVGWNALLDRFGGSSFGGGLYRVVRASDIAQWNARISSGFPEYGERVMVFGYDWLGRVFAIDPFRLVNGQPGVAMFEPGTGEVLEIPCDIATFHDEELITDNDAALAVGFHERWLNAGGRAPHYQQCVGYKIPLFLGGADEVDNLEVCDLDVYWHLLGQMIRKTKGLNVGTPILVRR